MIRPSDRTLVRLVAITTFIAALTLGACGRKGGLDAPPSSLPASPPPQASISPSGPGFIGSNFSGPTGSTGSASQNQTAQATPPPKKSFFLDWLIN